MTDDRRFLPKKVRRPREEIHQAVSQLELVGLTAAGSYRREKETVGDLDVLVPSNLTMATATHSARLFFGYEEIRGGDLKSEGLCTYRDQPLLINFWHVPKHEAWAAMLLFATGPHDLNIMMRAKAKGMNLTLSQYGLFQQIAPPHDDFQLDRNTEESIFDVLQLKYLTPVERENWRDHLMKKPSKSIEVQVPSSDGVNFYSVEVKDGKGWDCSCKGFAYRNTCRHLTEAEDILKRAP